MPQASYVLEVDFDNSGTFSGGLDDITAYVKTLSYSRGRDYASQLTGRAIAGLLSATLQNADGRFNPFLASGPLYGNLLPGRAVRLRATAPTAQTLWAGHLANIRPKPRAGGAHEAELAAVGPLAYVAERNVHVEPQTDIRTGAAIDLILDDCGWPAGARVIDTGQTVMARWWADGGALEALRQIADTESGFLGESATGDIVFEDRHHRLGGVALVSQVTFSDGGVATGPTLLDDLVYAFPLDEASGTRTDAVAGLTLTDVNTVTAAAGKLGGAAQFTRANNEQLQGADRAEYSHGNVDFTYAAWIWLDTRPGSGTTRILNKNRLVLNSLDDWEIAWSVDGASGQLMVLLANGDGTHWTQLTHDTFGALALGTWYFVMCWHDAAGDTLNLQVNNGVIKTQAWTWGSYDSDGPLIVGGSTNAGDAFSGRICSLTRWNRVLTDGERTALYGAGAGLPYPFTFSYAEASEADPLATIFNTFETEVRVFSVGTEAVLWTHPETGDQSPLVNAGAVREFWASYPSPASANDGVAVDAWTTPIPVTDYTANAAPDGSGADLTADLTVTAEKFSTSMKLTIENIPTTSGGQPAYVTFLQARGTPVLALDPVRVVTEDSDSQAKYGKRTFPNPAPWIPSSAEAVSWGGFNRAIYSTPLPILTLRIPSSKSAAYLTQAMTRDISDRVTVVGTGASLLGVAEDFYIENMHHDVRSGFEHRTVYELSPATGYSGFWIMNTSELSTETKLGY